MNTENKKKYKSFKEYCEDPEFKKKHINYIKTYIECEDCKKRVQRCALSRHRLSKKHIEYLKKKEGSFDLQKEQINIEVQDLRKRMEQLILKVNVVQ